MSDNNSNVHLDKRRCQNRDSQRRFRKKLRERQRKNKSSNNNASWTVSSSSANQLGHSSVSATGSSAAASLPSGSPPLLFGPSDTSPDHNTTSYFPTGQFQSPAWLSSSKSLPSTSLDNWVDSTDHHQRNIESHQVQPQQYANPLL
ncbi:uncharacterized protein PG986_000018 [Apiospora aurea]|uniref:BZIP domain-containing protein n=1 Tax=Apiospora aurea TaxID=335848 RepID=A0ABR1QSU2_9PEZI